MRTFVTETFRPVMAAIILAASISFFPIKAYSDDLSVLSLTRECNNCDFSDRDMTRIDLSGTILRDVNFSRAVLVSANFASTSFRGRTLFYSVNAQGADFGSGSFGFPGEPINIRDSDLRGANFQGAHGYLNFIKSNIDGTNFSSSRMQIIWSFDNVTARRANFSGLGSAPTGANINVSASNFSGSNFSNADIRGSSVLNSDLSDVNFSGANLRNVDFRNSDLSRANLEGANLNGANLTGTILCEAIGPNGQLIFVGCDD
jgi:uncharacterized protein YjbI with pentapeptide repeats